MDERPGETDNPGLASKRAIRRDDRHATQQSPGHLRQVRRSAPDAPHAAVLRLETRSPPLVDRTHGVPGLFYSAGHGPSANRVGYDDNFNRGGVHVRAQ